MLKHIRNWESLLLLLLTATAFGCQNRESQKGDDTYAFVNYGLDVAYAAALEMAKTLDSDSLRLPKTFADGKLETSDSRWWCSGFFPGTLWYLYEHQPTDAIKQYAMDYTERVEREKYTTDNHDVGFMIYCSFGNGYRLTENAHYKDVILQASRSLSTRYSDHMGLIRSWDWNKETWQYPVIIDNMMNLEMLLWAANESGEQRFKTIATNHADKTMAHHFRKDYSSYHVVDYDTLTAQPRVKQTWQGHADSSAWSRGQAWALYGYSMMYRMTRNDAYLRQAEGVGRFIMDHPHMPTDGIPYWDFDAPDIPNAPRDASAAAIMASAFIELSALVSDAATAGRFFDMATKQLRTLSSPAYLAEPGTNGNFILKHSVGALPKDSEIDQPLTYADYYYVEALMRLKRHLEHQY